MDLKAIADKTIPDNDGKQVLNKKGGTTADIVTTVLAAHNESKGQLDKFAPHLKGNTLKQTLYNVWRFWKQNIKYQVDPKGQQLIKLPTALWALKTGDCKSLSVAVMSTLESLGIKAAFRFTGYNGNTEFPTHVYVVVKNNGEEIPVDCVWKKFGEQKEPFSKNWDYNMPTDIYTVSGVDDKPAIGFGFGFGGRNMLSFTEANRQKRLALLARLKAQREGVSTGDIKKEHPLQTAGIKQAQDTANHWNKKHKRCKLVLPPGDITQEQLFLLLKKQGFEIEQRNHVINGGIGAIGDATDMAYEIQITGLHNAAAKFMGWPRKKLVGFDKPKHLSKRDHCKCSGFDSNGNIVVTDGNGQQIAMTADQANEAAAHIEGFFGDLWNGIKKGVSAVGKGLAAAGKAVAKGVVKVVTAVPKLLIKGYKAVGKFAGKILTSGARNNVLNNLPGYAPFFLYTYINDPKLLAKLPPIVATKRNKALEYKSLFTGKLQLSDANFDQAVRNGIMLRFNQQPEAVIAQWIRDTNFQVGNPVAIVSTAISALKGVFKTILGDTGENIGVDAEQYAPAPEDWGVLTAEARQRLGMDAQQQVPQPYTTDQLYNQVQTGQYQQQQYQQYAPPYTPPYQQVPADTYPGYDTGETNQYGAAADSTWGYTSADGNNPAFPDAKSALAKPQLLDEVVVRNKPAADNNSTGIAIAAIAAVLLIAGSKNKRA